MSQPNPPTPPSHAFDAWWNHRKITGYSLMSQRDVEEVRAAWNAALQEAERVCRETAEMQEAHRDFCKDKAVSAVFNGGMAAAGACAEKIAALTTEAP